MKRIYHHYEKWEDYHNGMYDEDRDGRKDRILKAVAILGDAQQCEKSMRQVIEQWKYATEFNLSNPEINRRAWLGQAACSISAGVHEDETRQAWGLLTPQQRTVANSIATRFIKTWIKEREDKESNQITLFDVWRDIF